MLVLGVVGAGREVVAATRFSAGAAAIDASPLQFPVLVNGGMLSQSASTNRTPIHARALVLASGDVEVAMVVVDSCMMPRPFLDAVKARAFEVTRIPAHRILISATHTHSAPSSMGCLGTDADPRYLPLLRDRIVEAIRTARSNLEPARVGFGKADAAEFTALRQWIRRPDRIAEDPFGNLTVRANMHAGANWDDVTGEAGPEDPDLALISVQSVDGRPIAVLGNFSMHYFSDAPVSADYFGLFSEGLKRRIAPGNTPGHPAFVGILSHGCSGDIWRRDYTRPAGEWNPSLPIDEYTAGLLDRAMKAYASIEYQSDVPVVMAEQRMTLKYRVPDKQRLEWAQRVVAGLAGRIPSNTTEVYAREQILLHEQQQTEVVVQALRIGDIGIATLPTETYAITGLKIKASSPLKKTVVIELANGGDGYIPPPEHHPLGGYNTWPARSAGLEVSAEPRLAGAAIELLERVTERPRRLPRLTAGPAARALQELRPVAWWRLDEFNGPSARDASGHGRDAHYEPGITFYLEGPASERFCEPGEKNRAAHFVGGRLRARLEDLADKSSVSLWFWNGMPIDARTVSGWLVSWGPDQGLSATSQHVGVGGAGAHPGRLIFAAGSGTDAVVAGRTEIPRWTWQHLVFTRDGDRVRAYLNGTLELESRVTAPGLAGIESCFFGGRSDNTSNWEGRLDEVAVFDRVLRDEEIARLAHP